MAGHDVLAKSRTGSGKTLAFALPIVERLDARVAGPTALILVPTRELAAQVATEFQDIVRVKGLAVATAYGGVSMDAQRKNVPRCHVLVATPGRLEDLAQRKMVRLDHVKILVLDEADRMLDMGFQPQVDRIVRRLTTERQTMFFSATLGGEVGRIARLYTREARMHEAHVPIEDVSEITHRFVSVTAATKLEALLDLLHREERKLALVFVRTKHGADRLADKLVRHGVRAEAMHGNMTQNARERALAKFDSGRVDTLVATDVAARGLDLDDITHVINFDPPADEKDYVHRVGRTGRAGRTGTGITLVLADQQADVSKIATRLSLNQQFEAEGTMKLSAPRTVYAAKFRGGRSPFRSRPRRRF